MNLPIKKVKVTLAVIRTNDLTEKLALWMPLLLGALVYWFLHLHYNIYYVDDSWTISNVWNFMKLGVAKDLVFLEPDGLGYHQFFGLTYYWVMGHLLEVLGWSKGNVFLVNSVFVWLTALVWWRLLRQLPFSKTVAHLTTVFLPVFPPFFFAAHSGRADAMTIFIISVQLLLFLKKRYLLAAFLTGVAFETHVMGAVGLFFMLACALYRRKEVFADLLHFRAMATPFAIGGLLGVAYYLLLHGNHFSLPEIMELIKSKKDMVSPMNNYILTYFTEFDWLSHLGEFVLLLAVVVIYLKKGLYRKNSFLAILLLVLVLSTFITRRENRNYFVYIFPAFLLMYFYTFEQLKRLKGFAVGLSVALGLYYGSTYYSHRDYDFEKTVYYIKKELKDESLPVIGMPDFWFAMMDRTFIPIHHSRDFNRLNLDKFYLLQTDYLSDYNRLYPYLIHFFLKNYNCSEISKLAIGTRGEVRICECENVNNARPKITRQTYPGWPVMLKRYFLKTIWKNN